MSESQFSLKEYIVKSFSHLVMLFVGICLVYLCWYVYKTNNNNIELSAKYDQLLKQHTDFIKLTENMSQLATSYKTQEELLRALKTSWGDFQIKESERIKSTISTSITIDSKQEVNSQSDFIKMSTDGKTKYTVNELRFRGSDSPPVGYILIKNDGSVFKENYEYEILVESVQVKEDDTGKIRVVSKAFVVTKSNGLAENDRKDLKRWQGVKYPLPVTGGETVVDPQEPSNLVKNKDWQLWSMNFNGGFGLYGRSDKLDSKISLDVSVLGYGYSKQDLDWKLMNVGLNYSVESGLGVHFVPVYYRPLPNLLTNTYVGGGVFIDPKGKGLLLGLTVGL